MTFKRYDVITFTPEDKVVVLESLVYEGNEYVFVNEVLPDESDTTDKYKVMVADFSDGTLQKVIDPNILSAIMPIFQEKLSKEQ